MCIHKPRKKQTPLQVCFFLTGDFLCFFICSNKRLEEHAGKPLTWLYCSGWNEEHFDEPRYPLKEELDALSKEIPIIMVRVCGHVAVCNTPGLERLKKIPQFAEIAKDVDFETGLLKENAVQFFPGRDARSSDCTPVNPHSFSFFALYTM